MEEDGQVEEGGDGEHVGHDVEVDVDQGAQGQEEDGEEEERARQRRPAGEDVGERRGEEQEARYQEGVETRNVAAVVGRKLLLLREVRVGSVHVGAGPLEKHLWGDGGDGMVLHGGSGLGRERKGGRWWGGSRKAEGGGVVVQAKRRI